MPMIPEAFIAMHACIRIGAIHSVVFGGFAPEELANRIQHSKPKLIVTASAGIEINKIIPYTPTVDKALELAGHPEMKRIIVQRRSYRERDIDHRLYLDFEEEIAKVPHEQGHEVVFVPGEHPFFILYTSGTTGQPKGIYRSHGGSLVAYNYKMKYIMDMHQRDVMLTPSDIGWIVGHSFIIYGPLLRGGTSVMYEGKPVGTPNSGVLFRLIEEHKVKIFFVAPTAVRAIKKEDYHGELIKQHDLSTLKGIHLAGERCDPDTVHWMQKMFPKAFINDNWWQTESGWMICSNFQNLGKRFKTKPGSATKPSPGWDVLMMDDEDNEFHQPNKVGKIMIRLPCPPGHMDGLWGND
mmetsp:Transcript_25481/g.19238  ORF Transcript_25481/g.19238 Transcript_25481/m.19238 type:complete len:352 (+) Transcript_25481:439-1494(+)